LVSTYRRKAQSVIDKLQDDYKDNTAIVQSLNYLKASARYKRPASLVNRVRNSTTTTSNSNYLPTVKPPYNNASLDRFEDCFRSDKLIQNGIVKRVELVIGQHGKIVMDTTDEYDNPDDRTAALENVQNNTKYQEARKKMQKLHIKPTINFHSNLKAATIQSKVYGRSAIKLVGQDDVNGLPEVLNVLNSKRLGNVEIDPDWQFLGVHYLDLPKGASNMEDVLPADELIYIANRDFHVSPGSLYYGLSELEGIVDGSDSKRIAKQEDIKEIMKSNWAPFLILKFSNPNMTVQKMQEIVNDMTPGLPFAHKQDIQTEIVNLQSDLKNITEAVDFLNRESLRELGVPAFVAGYEQIANYANSQQVLLAFKEIELEADRTALKDIIEHQWLNKLFYGLLDINPDVDEPEVKLKYEFEDISFETKLDKINGDLLLFDRQIIGGEKVLKTAGYDDLIEEYKLLQEEKKRQQLQMLQRFQMQNKQQGNQQDQQDGDARQDQPFQQGQTNNNNNSSNSSSNPASNQVSTTVRKRQGSYNNNNNITDSLSQKFIEALDSIVEK
jgi:hypothetical protein